VKPKVLVVDDEPPLTMMLRYNLERAGFAVRVCEDGEAALAAVAEDPPDVILLDWMLPAVSGLEVCRRIRRARETRSVPIIMLTARGDEADRVRGLDTGADDYITKPFSPVELIARLRALMRRARPDLGEAPLEVRGVVLDPTRREARFQGRKIALHPRSFDLLRFLMAHPGRVFSRERLLDAVWGRDVAVEPRAVDAQVRRLRRALADAGAPNLVRTARSAGYGLAEDGD